MTFMSDLPDAARGAECCVLQTCSAQEGAKGADVAKPGLHR